MNEDRYYLQFFNLNAPPFHDLKDPRFVWLGPRQLEHLLDLKNAIEQCSGIALLTGDEGTGKSVLVDRLIRSLPRGATTVLLREPGLQAVRLEELVCGQLHLPPAAGGQDFQGGVKTLFESARIERKNILLVIEDAENAEDEALERILWLSKVADQDPQKLVSILMTGDRRLVERLARPEHQGLQQQVTTIRSTEPLTPAETEAYIRHRMMVAGGFLEIFTADSVQQIHRFSGGLPKGVDVLCEYSLKRACQEKMRKINGQMIRQLAREIRAISPLGQPFTASESRPRSRLANLPLLTAAVVLAVALLLTLFKPEFLSQPPAPALPPPAFSMLFEQRSAAIPEGGCRKLDAAAAYLTANPGCRVVIKCPPSQVGATAQGKKLATARPEAVKAYLTAKGVAVDRIEMIAGAAEANAADRKKDADPSHQLLVEIYRAT